MESNVNHCRRLFKVWTLRSRKRCIRLWFFEVDYVTVNYSIIANTKYSPLIKLVPSNDLIIYFDFSITKCTFAPFSSGYLFFIIMILSLRCSSNKHRPIDFDASVFF